MAYASLKWVTSIKSILRKETQDRGLGRLNPSGQADVKKRTPEKRHAEAGGGAWVFGEPKEDGVSRIEVIEGVSATEVKKQKKCFKLCFEFSNGEVIGALNKGRFRTVGCGGGNE